MGLGVLRVSQATPKRRPMRQQTLVLRNKQDTQEERFASLSPGAQAAVLERMAQLILKLHQTNTENKDHEPLIHG
mgnify:CR=1 FL=1